MSFCFGSVSLLSHVSRWPENYGSLLAQEEEEEVQSSKLSQTDDSTTKDIGKAKVVRLSRSPDLLTERVSILHASLGPLCAAAMSLCFAEKKKNRIARAWPQTSQLSNYRWTSFHANWRFKLCSLLSKRVELRMDEISSSGERWSLLIT